MSPVPNHEQKAGGYQNYLQQYAFPTQPYDHSDPQQVTHSPPIQGIFNVVRQREVSEATARLASSTLEQYNDPLDDAPAGTSTTGTMAKYPIDVGLLLVSTSEFQEFKEALFEITDVLNNKDYSSLEEVFSNLGLAHYVDTTDSRINMCNVAIKAARASLLMGCRYAAQFELDYKKQPSNANLQKLVGSLFHVFYFHNHKSMRSIGSLFSSAAATKNAPTTDKLRTMFTCLTELLRSLHYNFGKYTSRCDLPPPCPRTHCNFYHNESQRRYWSGSI